MEGDVVSVVRVVPAPPEAIFALVADASRHPDIDGSGTVRQAKPGAPQRLALGSTFGMSMKMGIPYSMVNTIVEFEENRRIAWQARPPGLLGRFLAGRIWRYELEPVEGGTKVTETFDWGPALSPRLLERTGAPAKNLTSIEATLQRLDTLVTGGAD